MQRPDLFGFSLINRGLGKEFGRLAPVARAIRGEQHRELVEEQLRLALDVLTFQTSEQRSWVHPTLLDRAPEARPGLENLERDHRAITELVGPAGDPSVPLQERSSILQGLHQQVIEYLGREERDAVPVILAVISRGEWAASQKRVLNGVRQEQTPLLHGWLMDATPEEDRVDVFARLPLSIRIAYRFSWAAAYEKRLAALY